MCNRHVENFDLQGKIDNELQQTEARYKWLMELSWQDYITQSERKEMNFLTGYKTALFVVLSLMDNENPEEVATGELI